MKKILVYRNKNDGKIICIDDCPPFDKQKLNATIEEFNLTDKQNLVELKQIKENTLEDYLLTNYYQTKLTQAEEIQALLDSIFFNTKRLSNYFEVLYNEFNKKMNKI